MIIFIIICLIMALILTGILLLSGETNNNVKNNIPYNYNTIKGENKMNAYPDFYIKEQEEDKKRHLEYCNSGKCYACVYCKGLPYVPWCHCNMYNITINNPAESGCDKYIPEGIYKRPQKECIIDNIMDFLFGH